MKSAASLSTLWKPAPNERFGCSGTPKKARRSEHGDVNGCGSTSCCHDSSPMSCGSMEHCSRLDVTAEASMLPNHWGGVLPLKVTSAYLFPGEGGTTMKWITRERVKVDRVACPWLI